LENVTNQLTSVKYHGLLSLEERRLRRSPSVSVEN